MHVQPISTFRLFQEGHLLRNSIAIFVLTTLFYFIGAELRLVHELSLFWPLNGVMAGVFARYVWLNRLHYYAISYVAMLVYDAITTEWGLVSLAINFSNMMFIVTVALLVVRDKRLGKNKYEPVSALRLFNYCLIAALLCAIVGAIGSVSIDSLDFWPLLADWFSEQFSTGVLIVPCMLTLAIPGVLPRFKAEQMMPAIALIVSVIASVVIGGAGSLAFPLPALIWCAVRYTPQVTCLLTFVTGAVEIVLVANSVIDISVGSPFSIPEMFSARLGWFQGMGWPPCGRTMVHWWSQKERGGIVSVWNCAHNVGGGIPPLLFLLGMAWFNDWHAALYMPAFCAILVALFAFAMMRDTPQSCGLPPIEEYKNDYPDDYNEKAEQELTAKQIFMQYVLPNKLLWYIAIANVFVYLLRYGILDWSPTYLKEVKHFALDKSSWAYFFYEYAGIPGTLLCGWMSDKVFRGNRGATGVFFMTLVTIATIVYWMNPAGNPTVDMICMIVIGFLIYGPVMLIGLHALELAPKKAAGTAAGFTGLFGYLGGSVAASAIVGYTVDFFGWDGGFMVMIGGSILAVILLIVVMIGEKRRHEQLLQKRNGG